MLARIEMNRPELVWIVLAGLLVIILLGAFAFLRRHDWLKKISSLSRNVRPIYRFATMGLIILSIILTGMIITETKFFFTKKVPKTEKILFHIWIDVSKSILAQDIEKDGGVISRLEYQKKELDSLLERIRNDYISIGIFAEKSYPGIHPTLALEENMPATKKELNGLIDPAIISRYPQGSNIAAPIYFSSLAFRDESSFFFNQPLKRVVIILTDGERQGDPSVLTKDLELAFDAARQHSNEMSFYILGVGNPGKGSLIPEIDNMSFMVDKEGKLIRTKPDWHFLTNIAHELKGKFIPAKSGQELANTLDKIIREERMTIGTEEIEEEIKYLPRLIAILNICLLAYLRYWEV